MYLIISNSYVIRSASTLTVQQALLLVFARLASADPQGLVTFLSSQNALQPLLQLWLEKQVEIFGAYERRVTVAGLCKLLEFAAANGCHALLNLEMKKKIEGLLKLLTGSLRSKNAYRPILYVQEVDTGTIRDTILG